jgi:hypothetical protein
LNGKYAITAATAAACVLLYGFAFIRAQRFSVTVMNGTSGTISQVRVSNDRGSHWEMPDIQPGATGRIHIGDVSETSVSINFVDSGKQRSALIAPYPEVCGDFQVHVSQTNIESKEPAPGFICYPKWRDLYE